MGIGGAPIEQVFDLGDWKDFGAVEFRTKAKLTNDGQDTVRSRSKKYPYNTERRLGLR
jgi:hypothetical protein